MKPFAFPIPLLAALALATLAASPQAAQPATIVHIKSFAYDPKDLTIHAGDAVEWINDDNVVHSVIADDNSWKSGELGKGETWTHIFNSAGTYTYFCDEHHFMKASITVQ